MIAHRLILLDLEDTPSLGFRLAVLYSNTLANWPVACRRLNWPCWSAKSASRKATHLSLSSSLDARCPEASSALLKFRLGEREGLLCQLEVQAERLRGKRSARGPSVPSGGDPAEHPGVCYRGSLPILRAGFSRGRRSRGSSPEKIGMLICTPTLRLFSWNPR